MIKKLKTFGMVTALLATVTLTSSGCFWLLVGAAAGVGGYAWSQGEMIKGYDLSVTQLHDATIKGLKKLGTPILEDTHDRISAKIKSQFADRTGISINIEAVTEQAAKIKIRVGVIGDKSKSALILSAIEDYI